MTPEQYFALNCLDNATRTSGRLRRCRGALSQALIEQGHELGLEAGALFEDAHEAAAKKQAWKSLRRQITQRLADAKSPPEDEVSCVLDAVCLLFNLTPVEAAIFRLLAWRRIAGHFSEIYDALGINRYIRRTPSTVNCVAQLLNLPEPACVAALRKSSSLFSAGVCTLDDDGDIAVDTRIVHLVQLDCSTPDQLTEVLLGEHLVPELDWTDFEYVRDERDYLERLLRGAVQKGAKGVNVLVYGPPGTGKTELCKVLAQRIGQPLYGVGRSDESGDEPTRADRLSALRSLQKLVARGRSGLLLVDEAQDLFTAEYGLFGLTHRAEGSRVFVHELLERFDVPVLWTANDITGFGEAALRRMTHILEMRKPPRPVRATIWSRVLAQHNIVHSSADLMAIAGAFDSAPAIAASAARAAALAGGGLTDVRRAAASVSRVVDGREPQLPLDGFAKYQADLSCSDADLERLTDRLCLSSAVPRFSLCLFGPPGTGKSAYARHLAARLGLEVIHKRYSDLASKWVGETEQKIAAAFRDASAARAMLILDEADSLLSDRAGAVRSWEVSQVNEMLTWMESHPWPFVCTTNLMERIDPASLRRFTFKLRFGYLDKAALDRAFLHFFKLDPPAGLASLSLLTPGDFAVVQTRAELLGYGGEADQLLGMLREEQAMKPGQSRPIGFR